MFLNHKLEAREQTSSAVTGVNSIIGAKGEIENVQFKLHDENLTTFIKWSICMQWAICGDKPTCCAHEL